MFFPLMSGPDTRPGRSRRPSRCCVRRATGTPAGPGSRSAPGVHTGLAWVGAVGDESHTEITALGDTVNTTARLASAAAAGEVLVTVAAAAQPASTRGWSADRWSSRARQPRPRS